MIKTKIKPLSINKGFKGRRFKTQEHKDYSCELSYLLPNDLVIPKGELRILMHFGLSNIGSDIDNPVKIFFDVLQKKYDFNDSRFFQTVSKKEKVKKGDEFICFKIESVNDSIDSVIEFFK
jgi:Holliday junction resolvase RusA-like endonuclease